MSTNFAEMSVADLRKAARAKGATGVAVLTWSKVDLVKYMETGIEPVRAGAPVVPAGDLAAVIAGAVQQHLNLNGGSMDEGRVIDLIEKYAVKRINVVDVDGTTRDVGVQHEAFERILKIASIKSNGRRKNVMLVGPAGSGKTHCCHAVSTALGLEFRFIGVGQQTTKSDLLGYMDANGKYVATPLYYSYRDGGVFLLDEVDAGNANVLVVLNSLTANGEYTFPNGEKVTRHPDFICVAAANTYGLGQSRQYVGRNQLDAATRDRFVFVDFGYDEGLERRLAGDTPVTRRIQRIRAKVQELGEKLVVSPRASIDANDLVSVGFTIEESLEMTLWKGCDPSIKSRCDVK